MLVAGILAYFLVLSPASSQVSDPEPDVFRVVKVYAGKTVTSFEVSGVEGSDFVPNPAPSMSVVFPTSMGTVDVTATMTIEYRTTPGDDAVVTMEMKSPGTPVIDMKPGRFALHPERAGSTTVTWARDQVQPSDQPHGFAFTLFRGHRAEAPMNLRATEVVLVIEATPSEPG